MTKLIEITNEEFNKIIGITKYPKKEIIETIKVFLPTVGGAISSQKWEKEKLQEEIHKISRIPPNANAYIISSDKNEYLEPYFNTLFGMSPSHKSEYEITYIIMKNGSHCKI